MHAYETSCPFYIIAFVGCGLLHGSVIINCIFSILRCNNFSGQIEKYRSWLGSYLMKNLYFKIGLFAVLLSEK
jgi:hypothetical protein